jgi:ATP-dependent Zn protease
MPDQPHTTLAWPDHDSGPTPPPDSLAATRGAKTTRKKLPFFDRVKFLIGLTVAFFLFVWADMANIPILPFKDAVRRTIESKWWLIALFGLELLRQIHYFVSEHWSGYHRFWTDHIFGGLERRTSKLNDWNRFRIARAFKWIVVLCLFGALLGATQHESAIQAVFHLPGRLWAAAPMIIQVVFIVALGILQFVGIFWFMSRGGTDLYFPDDIKTRFTDVWGQDAVLERVKENILFLENPESIENKGGYVPSGILLWGPPGTGKGQPISAEVMTPTGPRRMGDLVPGDYVIGSNGRPTRILEVHLLGERDLYRVEFSDGSSLKVTEDHLWQVHSNYGGTKVRSTADLVDRLYESGHKARYHIPMVRPVEFEPADLPLDPYLLGALLGDGTFRHHLGFSDADLDVLARVELLLPDGDSMVRENEYDWSIIGGATRVAIKELELFGLHSHEKFIPSQYLWASAEQRLALLQGLMDTDGNLDTRGVVEFHTTSERLAHDVRLLVESFGGTASISTRVTEYTHNGLVQRGKPVHAVRMALPDDVVPVLSERKRERWRSRTRCFPQRRMSAIVPDGREESRCLRVEAEDHLYVTERFIVTHNTLMAEAVAGETGRPYVFVDPGAFQNMFFGVGILKVKSLFRKLRKLAVRYGGVIVFFDEADSLGNRGALAGGNFGFFSQRSPWSSSPSCNGLNYLSADTVSLLARTHMAHGAEEPPRRRLDRVVMPGMGGGDMGTLQALLTEISGLKKPRGFFNRVVRRTLGMRPKPPPKYRILIMMATNMPNALDEALLRPGRIDRIYKVGYPSKAGRIRTYEGYLAKVSHELTREQVDKLATITPYATGATIKDLVNEALIQAIRDERETITWADILRAKQLKELGPPEDVEYIERERHAVAIHEACHAVVAAKVRHHLTIDIATIEKGGTYLGMVASIPPEDQFTRWRSEYEADIMVSLASLAGERLFYEGDNSSGVSGDLESATAIASFMEGYWGMGRTVASHGVTKEIGIMGGGKPGPGENKEGEKALLEGSLGQRIEDQLADILDRTRQLLDEHRHLVLAIAHALETNKTLTGEDIVAIIEGRPGPLIDGRPYHDPEFGRLAEAYHERALSAHKRHASVDLPLPVFGKVTTNGNGHGHLVAEGSVRSADDWGSPI